MWWYPHSESWVGSQFYPILHGDRYSLLKAVLKDDVELIDKIVDENKFDINSPLDLLQGVNAATIAAEYDKLEMLHYLHLKGADINNGSGKFKITPLMAAVNRWNPWIVEYLLEQGVDQSVKDVFGFTALDKAKARNLKTITIMLKNPPKVNSEEI